MKKETIESLVTVLNKEIELNITARFTWRIRANFTLFLSPFILLGAYLYAYKDKAKLPQISENYHLIIFCALVYIVIGICSSVIESRLMKRNNLLRKQIIDLHKEDYDLSNLKLDRKEYLVPSYIFIYFLMLLEFYLIYQIIFDA